MNILICPDSFKNSMSAIEVAQIIGEEFSKAGHSCTLEPLADGGEGTVDTLLFDIGGEKQFVNARDPLGREIETYYGLNKHTAYMEMAQAAGIQLLSADELDPMITTTYGVGQQIKDALGRGVKRVIIGIGGSATNDCGIGMAQALGVRFLDAEGTEVSFRKDEGYCCGSLASVESIDYSQIDPRISQVKFRVLSDVENPLLGENGASYTYAPQKGADSEMVQKLEGNLEKFSHILSKTYNKDPNFPGAGAAGGLGAGLKLFLGAQIVSGINGFIKYLHLEEKVQDTDLVVVGEGKMCYQTVFGKAPAGIARLAKRYGKPVIAMVGAVGKDYQKNFEELKIDHIFSCHDEKDVIDLEQIKREGPSNLRKLCKLALKKIPSLSSYTYQLTTLSHES